MEEQDNRTFYLWQEMARMHGKPSSVEDYVKERYSEYTQDREENWEKEVEIQSLKREVDDLEDELYSLEYDRQSLEFERQENEAIKKQKELLERQTEKLVMDQLIFMYVIMKADIDFILSFGMDKAVKSIFDYSRFWLSPLLDLELPEDPEEFISLIEKEYGDRLSEHRLSRQEATEFLSQYHNRE